MFLVALFGVVGAHGPDGYRDLSKQRPVSRRDGHNSVTHTSFNYTVDGEEYEGYVAYPTGGSDLPAIMIVHQWYGLGENEMFRAEEAAEEGYFAFAVDMYGAGRRASDNAEAGMLSGEVAGNLELLVSRMSGAMDQIMAGGAAFEMASINTSAVTCNGYCFGGNVCLQYTSVPEGADVVATSVFHATFPNVTGYANPSTAVQIHHGQNDFAGDAALYTLQDQLTDAGVTTWESSYYSGAFHGFSDILSDAFLERVAVQSHASMFSFYAGILQTPEAEDCVDDSSWYKTDEPSKNCAWVALHQPRCDAVGFPDGVRTMAMDACVAACGLC